MSWSFPVAQLARATTLPQVKAVLVATLPDLFHLARLQEKIALLPYGPTVRPSGDTRQAQRIEVTDGTAFTVANPTNPREGVELILDFLNSSGGSIGAVTFGSEYRLDGAFDPPDVDGHAVYTFAWFPV